MENTLEIQGLSKSYGKKQAVREVSFCIAPGEIFGLMGMNGAGKTTLLRMLATLLKPDSGDAYIAGNSIVKAPEKVRACISYLPDEAGAYRSMTGRKYLALFAGLWTKEESEQKICVQRGEEICGLGDDLDRKIRTYSRGMIRKLALARAVMCKPKLAILDEPTSGLDVLNSLDIRQTIRRCAEEFGTAFLLSSHHLHELETTAHRGAILKDGCLLAEGTPAALREQFGAATLEEAFERAVRNT